MLTQSLDPTLATTLHAKLVTTSSEKKISSRQDSRMPHKLSTTFAGCWIQFVMQETYHQLHAGTRK